MLSDAVFNYGVHDFVTRHLPHAGNNSVFQYLYSHEGTNLVLLLLLQVFSMR